LFNWRKIFQDRDYRYALLDIKGSIDKDLESNLMKWQDECTNEFGTNEAYLDYVRADVSLEILKLERVISGDKSLDLLIEIAQKEFDDTEKKNEKNSGFQDLIIEVEKHMGFKINTKETTVFEFYSYVKNLERTIAIRRAGKVVS
jgi:hypothetical protein